MCVLCVCYVCVMCVLCACYMCVMCVLHVCYVCASNFYTAVTCHSDNVQGYLRLKTTKDERGSRLWCLFEDLTIKCYTSQRNLTIMKQVWEWKQNGMGMGMETVSMEIKNSMEIVTTCIIGTRTVGNTTIVSGVFTSIIFFLVNHFRRSLCVGVQ